MRDEMKIGRVNPPPGCATVRETKMHRVLSDNRSTIQRMTELVNTLEARLEPFSRGCSPTADSGKDEEWYPPVLDQLRTDRKDIEYLLDRLEDITNRLEI